MRSILKHPHLSDLNYHQQCPEPFPFATCATVVEVAPHVHFPPTPTLTSTFITHSSSVYDRTPAEVQPNICALPGRHEREIVDIPHSRHTRRMWDREDVSSYFYPRGSAIEPSESDDSDAVRTPPEPLLPGPPIAVRFGCRNMSDAMSPYGSQETSLLLLPHTNMPLKMKKGSSRSHSQGQTHCKVPRQESADGRIQRRSDFSVPTLDFEGCLGGF